MPAFNFCLLLFLNIGLLHAGPTNRRFCMSIMRMDCSVGFAPNVICGSNGITYPNDCAFSKGMCETTNLSELHKGPCVVSTTPEPTTPEPTTPEPTTPEPTTAETTTVENKFCRTILERNCEDLKDEFICGTDGRTYRNDCVFSKAMCKDLDLDEDYKGPCLPPTTTEATTMEPSTTEEPTTEEVTPEPTTEEVTPEPTTEEVTPEPTTEAAAEITTISVIETTKPEDCISCQLILNVTCTGFQNVCIYGSDGVTYPNDCEFLKAFCQDTSLKELNREPCEVTTELPVTEPPTTFIPTTMEITTPELATPIVTTEIVTESLVTTTTEAPSTVTTPRNEMVTKDFRPIIKEFFCTWNWGEELVCEPSSKDYACASDKRTYRTKCDLAKATCDFPTLHIVKDGICPGDKYAFEYKHHSFVSHMILP